VAANLINSSTGIGVDGGGGGGLLRRKIGWPRRLDGFFRPSHLQGWKDGALMRKALLIEWKLPALSGSAARWNCAKTARRQKNIKDNFFAKMAIFRSTPV